MREQFKTVCRKCVKMTLKRLKDFLLSIDATMPCHRCGNTEMAIIEGEGSFIIKQYQGRNENQALPVMFVVCSACGAVTPHALKAVDLVLPATKEVN